MKFSTSAAIAAKQNRPALASKERIEIMDDNKQGVNALTLEGEAFNALKADFNMVLRKTIIRTSISVP